mgnify:CR=1 FL=1
MTRAHIGTPCPVCGENMLTEADYKLGKRVMFFIGIAEFFGLVRRHQPGEFVGPDEKRISINPHAGEVRIREKLGRL